MIIKSILDTDLYKLTMQMAIMELYPDAIATYKFINRQPTATVFTQAFLNNLKEEVEALATKAITESELQWLKNNCYFLKPWYFDYLRNYRFNLQEIVQITQNNGQLHLTIHGPWHHTVLWEVPLMAIISELYFYSTTMTDMSAYEIKTAQKAQQLSSHGVIFSDFGTRRRRSRAVQDLVVGTLKKHSSTFFGTSNPYFAQRHNCRPVGTMAHEWLMAHSVLSGLRHANRAALKAWVQVYQGNLGIALTDTYGLKAFWEDFDPFYAKLFEGVRQDSANPFTFVDQACNHYQRCHINPLSKVIVFSDSLNVQKAQDLHNYCQGKRIQCSFGIGTNFTNDFPDALNMVIKLDALNGEKVCKLGEDSGKESGDPTAIKIAKHVFYQQPLL